MAGHDDTSVHSSHSYTMSSIPAATAAPLTGPTPAPGYIAAGPPHPGAISTSVPLQPQVSPRGYRPGCVGSQVWAIHLVTCVGVPSTILLAHLGIPRFSTIIPLTHAGIPPTSFYIPPTFANIPPTPGHSTHSPCISRLSHGASHPFVFHFLVLAFHLPLRFTCVAFHHPLSHVGTPPTVANIPLTHGPPLV